MTNSEALNVQSELSVRHLFRPHTSCDLLSLSKHLIGAWGRYACSYHQLDLREPTIAITKHLELVWRGFYFIRGVNDSKLLRSCEASCSLKPLLVKFVSAPPAVIEGGGQSAGSHVNLIFNIYNTSIQPLEVMPRGHAITPKDRAVVLKSRSVWNFPVTNAARVEQLKVRLCWQSYVVNQCLASCA